MGARVSKYVHGTNEAETPPMPSVKRRRFLLCDPRSPSFDIMRTPIQMNCSVAEISTPESETEPPHKQLVLEKDPRSPTEGIVRTPLTIPLSENDRSNHMAVNVKKFLETDLDAICSVSPLDDQANSSSDEQVAVSTIEVASNCVLEDSQENTEPTHDSQEEEKEKEQDTENNDPCSKEEIDKLLKKLSESYPTPKECKVQYSKFHNDLVRKQSVNAFKKQLFLMPDKKDAMLDYKFTQDNVRRPLSNVSNVTSPHQKLTSVTKSVIVKEKYTTVKQSAIVKENFMKKSKIANEEQNNLIFDIENTPPRNSVARKCQLAQWDQDETVII